MRITNRIGTLLGVSLLLGAGFAARADDTITFQVDMSRYTNSAGAQAATLVDVRGNFAAPNPNWSAGLTLVNNGANVYTNTFNIVGAAATDIQYKFTFTTPGGTTWEDDNPPPGAGQPPDAGNNRVLTLSGGTQTLPVVPLYAPSVTPPLDFVLNNVTFNVDMSAMTNSAGAPAYTAVNASGLFNGWGQDALVNNGANVYTNTFVVGANGNYKYTCVLNGNTVYEDGSDHPIVLTGSPQTLPLLVFNNSGRVPIDFTTNNITFQVDMRAQGQAFITAGGSVTVSGGFTGWGAGVELFNNPSAPYPENWVYTNTLPVAYQKAYPTWSAASQFVHAYKFRANSGWEEPAVNPLFGNNDRRLSGLLQGPADTLPLVLYSDASLCDILPQETAVTFVVHITNGTTALDGIVFDNTSSKVHINGESVLGTWQPWNFSLPTLDREGTSDYYTNTFIIPPGRPRNQKVKYSITDAGDNGGDNENVQFSDHIQWIRGTNSTYRMDPVEFGTNFTSSLVQPNFGDLKAGAASGGTVPITWLGCGCVTLQSKTDLVSGSWADMPETDGTGSTNVANTGTKFFRLQKRPNP